MNKKATFAAVVLCLSVTSVYATGFDCEGQDDVNYPNPDACNSYIACTNGRSIVMPCPHKLHYTPDPRLYGHCDYPENVACKEPTESTEPK